MDKYDVEYRMRAIKDTCDIFDELLSYTECIRSKVFAKFLMNSSRMIQEMIFGSDVCVKPRSAV